MAIRPIGGVDDGPSHVRRAPADGEQGMTAIRSHIRFILNGETVSLADIRPDETLLDFLRLRRSLRGTKEGCAEGDCGACTVLVGRLAGDRLVYEGVNAC